SDTARAAHLAPAARGPIAPSHRPVPARKRTFPPRGGCHVAAQDGDGRRPGVVRRGGRDGGRPVLPRVAPGGARIPAPGRGREEGGTQGRQEGRGGAHQGQRPGQGRHGFVPVGGGGGQGTVLAHGHRAGGGRGAARQLRAGRFRAVRRVRQADP